MPVIKYIGNTDDYTDPIMSAVWDKDQTRDVTQSQWQSLLDSGRFIDATPYQNPEITAKVVTNTLTGGIAISAGTKDALSGISRAPLAGNVGMRIVGGRMENVFANTSNDRTFQAIFEVKRKVKAVSFLIAQGRVGATATDTPAMSGNAFCCASFADADIDAGGANRVGLSFGGSGSGTMPAPTVDYRRKMLWTDFVDVTHVPRADGKPGSFVGVRLLVGTTARLVLMGNGTDDFGVWETKTDGGAFHFRYRNFSSGLTAGASTFTSNAKGSPVVGVRYLTEDGAVCNVCAFGDSIDEGRDTYKNEGFTFFAAVADVGDVVVEPSDLAWAGRGTVDHVAHLTDAVADGVVPHIAVFPSGSPNDTSSTLDYIKTTAWMDRTTAMLNTCRNNGITPVVRNMTPVANAVKAFGATDSLRRQHNQLFTAALARSGVQIIDADSVVAGSANASGQIELAASASLDGIHLTRAATEQIGGAVAASIARVVA